jgi:hypothetical protein
VIVTGDILTAREIIKIIDGDLMNDDILQKEDLAKILSEASVQMRLWLTDSVFESASSGIIEEGADYLKKLIIVASDKTGVKEQHIVARLARNLEPRLAGNLTSWFSHLSGAGKAEEHVLRDALPGDAYLIYSDRARDAAFSIFLGLLLEGKYGFVLTRRPQPALECFGIADVRIVTVKKQLGRLCAGGPEFAPHDADDNSRLKDVPLLRVVRNHLTRHPDSIVMIDCMDYLKQLNGFPRLFAFVSDIMDIARDTGSLLLFDMMSSSFEEKELASLEGALEVLVERPSTLAIARQLQRTALPWSVSPS